MFEEDWFDLVLDVPDVESRERFVSGTWPLLTLKAKS
ncbi:MAG: hypothetical protein CM15mV33_130 [uncultured marine virus]|nr:MAG: hypothetical protein CM15mV33_130 [uncultured marine virus]